MLYGQETLLIAIATANAYAMFSFAIGRRTSVSGLMSILRRCVLLVALVVVVCAMDCATWILAGVEVSRDSLPEVRALWLGIGISKIMHHGSAALIGILIPLAVVTWLRRRSRQSPSR